MISLGSILFDAVRLAFGLYELLILVRVFMSWLPINPYSRFATFVRDLTDPFLGLIERYMPAALLSPLNFSPIIALMLLSFAERLIMRLLATILFSSVIP